MPNCKNCDQQINEKFCSNCGQSATLKRIDNHYISHEVLHLLHFEKGFLFTAKELITRPGQSISTFINENRNRHMKPVPFIIITSLLYTVIAHFIRAEEINNGKEQFNVGESGTHILKWVQAHYGYANIMMGFFIALVVQLFFRKYKYNFYEITVLLCFVMGQGMLLITFVSFFYRVLSYNVYITIFSVIALAYPTWAIGQFFDKGKTASYVKAFFAYIAGYLLFYVAIILIGLAADLIIKIL